MKVFREQRFMMRIEQFPLLVYLLKWIVLSAVSGACIGSASALLLVSLNWATDYRESHLWVLFLLPLAGLLIGLMYHYLAGTAARGNNYLIEEIRSPHDIIPFRMAPLVYIGTVLTHLFGGSAGREGTGVQMGGAIADQFSRLFHLHRRDHKVMVLIGISAGFASVFGTPLAGAVFGLEVIVVGRMRYEAILPAFLSAAFAHLTCHAWGVAHTQYAIPEVPALNVANILWVALAGVLFGLVAMLFSRSIGFWGGLARRYVSYPPLRPFWGGILIALAVWLLGTTKYIGLGVPVFFVGATLGSALSAVVPLPMTLLAGLGFVAVFAGATNTPIACTLMGIELFGAEAGLYLGIACVIAYLFSGHTGIYTAQVVGSPKHSVFLRKKGTTLS